jgi:hypothetical protein
VLIVKKKSVVRVFITAYSMVRISIASGKLVFDVVKVGFQEKVEVVVVGTGLEGTKKLAAFLEFLRFWLSSLLNLLNWVGI